MEAADFEERPPLFAWNANLAVLVRNIQGGCNGLSKRRQVNVEC
jgi:hypothetical protein